MQPLALSTWSVHGLLGQARFQHDFVNEPTLASGQAQGEISLLELPAMLADAGITRIEICHFHLPSIKPDYLQQLRTNIESAGLEIENILFDTGNLSNPDLAAWQADLDAAHGCQRIAAQLGAKSCRFDCGSDEPTADTKHRSITALSQLADHAATLGLTTTTENFKRMSVQTADLLEIMQGVGRPLNLCVDLGNAVYSGDKYGTLETLMPLGTSLHCKAEYIDGQLDRTDLHHCLTLAQKANFNGFTSIIVNETENEWEMIIELRDAIHDFLAAD